MLNQTAAFFNVKRLFNRSTGLLFIGFGGALLGARA